MLGIGHEKQIKKNHVNQFSFSNQSFFTSSVLNNRSSNQFMIPYLSEAHDVITEESHESHKKTMRTENENPFISEEAQLDSDTLKKVSHQEAAPNFSTETQPEKGRKHLFARSPITDAKLLESKQGAEKLLAESCFDIREFMSNRNSQIIHTDVKSSEKIEISPDGKYVFFGGSGLHILEICESEYKMIRHDSKQGNVVFSCDSN